MSKIMTDLETFMLDAGFERIFRMEELKRNPTQFENYEFLSYCPPITEPHYIKIKEVIELPDKDILIGYHEIFCWDDLDEENPIIYYKKLSEIELSFHPEDMKEENWD